MLKSSDSKRRLRQCFTNAYVRFSLFALAVLLFGATVTTGILAARQTKDALDWVLHTYDVRSCIQSLQADILEEEHIADVFLFSSGQPPQQNFSVYVARQQADLNNLLRLTHDNSQQESSLKELSALLGMEQLGLSQCTQSSPCLLSDSTDRQKLRQGMRLRHERVRAILDSMVQEEQSLLAARFFRLSQSQYFFRKVACVVILCFLLSLLLLFVSSRWLYEEINSGKRTERELSDSRQSYRALSGRILELQDMERRRIARELHDSVGQYLTGIKLLLGQLGRGLQHTPTTTAALLSESIELADLSLTEIRTISHLLHPPLLDELGFSSAARAYVEGFCKRSGLEIQIAIEDFEVRLPKDLELALFRILQEALTNVHRHAAATRVTVHVANRNNCVTLLMKDNGCGISPTVLHRYQKGLASGIGLAGMRERIAEWKGTFDVQSSSSGTVVFASIPHQSVWTEILEDETAAAQRDQFLEAHTDGHLETLNQEITTLSDSDAPEIDHHNNQNN